MAEKNNARETHKSSKLKKATPLSRPAGVAAVRLIIDDAAKKPKAYVDRFVVPSEGE